MSWYDFCVAYVDMKWKHSAASPDLSQGLMADAGGRAAGFWTWILCRGMTVARLSGRVAGVPRSPGISFLARQDWFVLVRWGAGWPGRAARR
jgi:hypothetical protein